MDAAQLNTKLKMIEGRKQQGILTGKMRTYEFIFIPCAGFLNSNMPLLNNTELKLSFDRNFAKSLC